MILIEIMKKYSTNKKCIELLERIRWSNGTIEFPYCKSKKINKKTEKRQQNKHQCQECKKSFTITVGTIFHKAKKFNVWFMVLDLMLNAKKSLSTYQVSRDIGIRQHTI